jgi:DNA-directed RNA polymerase subunit RPC12/RpoP
MVQDVNLVGSRVSAMHLTYDCLGCRNAIAVSITDGKEADGSRCLTQRPAECPDCGERIAIGLIAKPLHSDSMSRR